MLQADLSLRHAAKRMLFLLNECRPKVLWTEIEAAAVLFCVPCPVDEVFIPIWST